MRERENEPNKCNSCRSYKKNMCVCISPSIKNKPFGFPFRFHPGNINCQSWEKKNQMDDITWEHM